MGLIKRMFGGDRYPVAQNSSHMHSQLSMGPASQQHTTSQSATRKELLRVVLRDTLHRHGIPPDWIGAETLTVTSRTGERAVHWRLLVKHWDPRLLEHGVALQQALIKRVLTFDPVASNWLSGISWQFTLDDESVCPQMPHPGSWTAQPQATPTAVAEPVAQGDVIAGPVHIADPQPQPAEGTHDARADLDALLAIRDADFQQHADAPGATRTWARTEPARL